MGDTPLLGPSVRLYLAVAGTTMLALALLAAVSIPSPAVWVPHRPAETLRKIGKGVIVDEKP